MKDMEFTVADVKDLMEAFSRNRLGSIKIEQGAFKLTLEARAETDANAFTRDVTAVAAHGTEAQSARDMAEKDKTCGNIVKSPIVGTFYAAAAPGKAPFVKAGGKVRKGDVLFIVESMKLMNEVTSEFDGVVKEIFVQNGAPVEYGQPVISIE